MRINKRVTSLKPSEGPEPPWKFDFRLQSPGIVRESCLMLQVHSFSGHWDGLSLTSIAHVIEGEPTLELSSDVHRGILICTHKKLTNTVNAFILEASCHSIPTELSQQTHQYPRTAKEETC